MRKKRLIAGVAQVGQCGDVAANLATIVLAAEEARGEGVELLVFPECALTGYGPAAHGSLDTFADKAEVAGALKVVRQLARRARMGIVLGTHLPLGDGWSNSVVMIAPSGRTVRRYDKAHLYGRGLEYYRAGRERPQPVTVRGVKVGMQICLDLRFPEPFRALACAGAEVLAVPSHIHGKGEMWKGPVMASHVVSRAAENGRFVIFANAAGRTQNAASVIADPRGEIIARARRGARQVVTARLDLTMVNDRFLQSRREDLYGAQARRGGGA